MRLGAAVVAETLAFVRYALSRAEWRERRKCDWPDPRPLGPIGSNLSRVAPGGASIGPLPSGVTVAHGSLEP